MKILVTGSTGFVGRHVVKKLLDNKHNVICITRDVKRLKIFDWADKVKIIKCDLYKDIFNFNIKGTPDALIHLAWSGLPNYQSSHHLDKNFIVDQKFLSNGLDKGLKQILVTGTCYEFGKQYGPLSPDMPTIPNNPYGIAKNKLRKWLEDTQEQKEFLLQWVRLFYMYGSGQNSNSIIAQLDRAIDNGESVFNMSGGEQLRDYLPVEKVAQFIVSCVENKRIKGIIHCCSGRPISIRRLVEDHIEKRNAKIKLNLGYYPYPEHESMAFWGVK